MIFCVPQARATCFVIHLHLGNHTQMQYLVDEAQNAIVAFDASEWKSSVELTQPQYNG